MPVYHPMRLVLDPPRRACLNMAIDEMLTEQAVPCLRIYFWERPSISIGYFQDVGESARLFQCGKKNIPVVRRLTGGGLVLHGKDLTFSLILRSDNPFLPADVKESYLKVAEALRAGLKDSYRGLDYARCAETTSTRVKQRDRICFQQSSCHDLLWRDRKVMGASQRRLRGMILHQSAVFLDEDKKTLTGKIVRGFEKSWKISFREQPLTESEVEKAGRIESERYSSKRWAFGVWPSLSSRSIRGNYRAVLQACGRS